MKSKSLELHKKYRGKWETGSKVPLNTREDLSTYYSPGVAEPSLEIHKDKKNVDIYTNRKNVVAVISDGSAVLGLGNIGPEASLPVMEGKAILFKKFGGIDSVPIILKTQDTDEIISTIKNISPSFGGINLEDISAPKAITIERTLIKELDIPVFHDDQHGTAIVVCAAIINASKLTGKKISELDVFMTGLGAAGISVARMVKKLGVKSIIAYDKDGYVRKKRKNNNFAIKELFDENILTSASDELIALEDGFESRDIFIGLSAPNIVTEKMVTMMKTDPWIFALANPNPEIMPELAKKGGAKIVGTGRSDYPNQINNLLAFPGIFKGVLTAGINLISEEIKLIAANAIALCVPKEKLAYDFIVPDAMDTNVPKVISSEIQKVV